MRLAAAACGVAILACVAVVGAVLAQKPATMGQSTAPVLAPPVAAPGPVVTTLPDPVAIESLPRSAPMPPASMTAAPTDAAALARISAAPNVLAQASPPRGATAAAPTTPPAPSPSGASCAGNPNALGVARTVEIDTTGGPGFGFEHFKSHDFLREGEVVLTFDDGPWPKHTAAVIAALAAHCTKAIFFPIGKHATYEPGILKQVAAAGHAVGSHTWSHQICRRNRCRRERTRSRRASARCAGRSAPRRRPISASRRCGTRRSSSPISANAMSASSQPISTPSISRCASPSRFARRSWPS